MSVLAGRYELGDELGAGGMARVVAAHDRLLDRPVAVKLLGPGSAPAARQRFLREARAAAGLRHPGAVAVHDTGEDGDRAFIVMELVSGESLADLLDRRGLLDVEEAVAITVGVLEVLAHAHAAGMVHRDVKPANVLLPDGGGVKLVDFGLAKALDETGGLTTTGGVVGTPAYLAPELVDGAAPSPASDVYSVGCLLYALLAGRPPFTGDSPLAVAYAHRHEPVPAIETLRPDVPEDVQAVLTRALAKDPSDRFPDAASMRAVLLGDPVADTAPTRVSGGPAPLHDAAPPDAPAAAGAPAADGRRAWWLPLGLIAVAVPLALAAWLLGGGTDGEPDDAGGAGAAQQGAADDDAAERGGPDDGAATGGADEGEAAGGADEEEAAGGADEEEAAGEVGAGEEPGSARTLTELIAVLADAPPGTYGEKHDDLLEDLLEVTREQDPRERAEEAADLREDVEAWVGDGELDPDVGGQAAALLAEESAER